MLLYPVKYQPYIAVAVSTPTEVHHFGMLKNTIFILCITSYIKYCDSL